MILSSLQPRSKRILALFSLITAALSGGAYLLLPWKETVDFDVVGFLWLLRNTPKLAAAVTFWVALVGAAVLWLHAKLGD
ncbi:MAG TPA: hypothetical protein VGS98_16260 [Thermoanaerobaculia bacterium]|nr:hypothetical protein [Thermoanaerobaculia bacterium]